jgi:sialic acid synthase SpsE
MREIYIIAEAGINHNGSLSTAKELIDAAVKAKADAVKFQTFWNISKLRQYELSKEEFHKLKEYCNNCGIDFLSTPHTFDAIHFLDDLVSMYKVASTYLGNINFLREVAGKNKTILLSTGSLLHDDGMATNEEIKNALSYIPNSKVVLMHCVSKYPCDNPRFDILHRLKEFNTTIGISDHSRHIEVPRASVLEKHLKINDNCIDRDVSLTPSEFKEFVKYVRKKE